MILCGGKGTRLREETEYRPKPLVEIGGRPILWHIMKVYAHHGFTRFILALGYKGHMIKEYFQNYQTMAHDFTLTLGDPPALAMETPCLEKDWRITFVDTGLAAKTGCRLHRVRKQIDSADFLLCYGDGLSAVDLKALYAFHRRQERVATITGVHPRSRFGELVVDGNRVSRFREKPTGREGYINGGFFAFDERIFNYLSDNDDCRLEGAPLERLAAEGELAIWRHDAPWYCMDTHRDFLLLNQRWKSGGAEWKIWTEN